MFRKKKAKDKEIQNTFVDEHIDLSDDWSEEESLKDPEKLDDLEELEDLDSKDDEKDSKEKEKKSNTFDVGDGEYMIEDEKKISGKKIAAIVAGVLLLAGVGIFFLVKNMGAGEDSKVYVESVGVITGLSSANGGTNRYTGEVEAQESWKITLDADMSVEECYVKVGDEVKKDDKLFKYNTEELKLNKEKKELELETMQNEINQLTRDISTYQNDLKSASTSEKIELQTQILTAQTTIKKNEFSIKSGKEELEKIKANIEDATVKSKMDGVVKTINTALGQSTSTDEEVTDTGSTDDANVYMTVLSIGDYRVKGKITETNVADIMEGDRMIVRSRVDDTTWNGTVDSVKTDETTSDQGTTTSEDYGMDESSGAESASSYYFYVELDNTEGLLMGQHVFLELDNGQDEKEGIWISSAYILADGDDYYVWADKKGRLEKRKVEVGQYDETMDEYQVLSGITLQDYIACDDIDIKSGMKTTKVDPFAEEGEDQEGDFGNEGMEGDDFDEEGMEGDDFDEEGMEGDDFDEEYDDGGSSDFSEDMPLDESDDSDYMEPDDSSGVFMEGEGPD